MVVFDVGSNFGGVTSAMSRLVGPMGTVCAFEASPRIIGYLQGNVVAQGHRNVTVYHRAVFSESNKFLKVFEGGHLNDSIFEDQSPTKIGRPVKTISLDHFCRASGLSPGLIKLDIEGAEYDALLGATAFISHDKPHLILEQQSADSRCFLFLKEKGYTMLDLATYEMIADKAAYEKRGALFNMLAVHAERLQLLPYKLPLSKCFVTEIQGSSFEISDHGGFISNTIELPAGRFVVYAEFSAAGINNSMTCGVRAENREIFRYHAFSKLLAEHYREWVFELPQPGKVNVFFEFQDGTSDPSLWITKLQFHQLVGIDSSQWAQMTLD
jgi:FkbM family methyltransferase